MAEVTNELLYEVLKAVQARLGNLEEGQRNLSAQVHAVRGNLQAMQAQMGAIQTDIANLYESFAAFDGRLSRIERRLEIIDTPAS